MAVFNLVFAAHAIVDGIHLTVLSGRAVCFASRWLFVVGGVLGIALAPNTLVSPGVTARPSSF